jgi:hypothetical protein
MNSADSEEGPMAGCCAHCNEVSDFIKSRELFDQLSDYQLLKEDPVPWSECIFYVTFKNEYKYCLFMNGNKYYLRSVE